MKKMVAFIMALCLCLGVVSFAEGAGSDAVVAVPAGEPVVMDLNGDGVNETVDWYMVEDTENYTEEVFFSVTAENGDKYTWNSYLYFAKVFLADVDEDGIVEMFITGDEMSCDYYTFCLQYTAEGLLPVQFANVNRGTPNEGYYDFGYGLLESISGGTVTLTGSQDVLGTYFGSRAFGLADGRFETVDDGLWRFDDYDFEDAEIWEYVALTPMMDIECAFMGDDGMEYDGVIKAGEKFIVTASDKVSIVCFRMQDGRTGSFDVVPDTEWGFGYYIGGVHESELFEYIPYAD